MHEITFYIQPVAKGRPRFTRNGHAFTPAKTRQFESAIRNIAQREWGSEPLRAPIYGHLIFRIKRPKSVRRQFPTVKPDLDNLQKSFFDGVSGVLFVDDNQVCRLMVEKEYADEGSIEFKFSEIVGDE